MPDLASLNFIEDLVINAVHSIRLYVDPKTGKRIIAKVLNSSSVTPKEINMLVKEYEIASSLAGESHIKPLALEYQGARPVVLYEDFSGVSLADILNQGPLELTSFFQTAIALCDALGKIHQQNVVHQDIKPSNIMVNQHRKEYRYNDFSLARKWTRQDERWIGEGQGTLKYLSPEQTGRIDCYIDYRTDFYSLGVTFYKMVCGKLPFESDDPGEIMHAQIAQLPDPPHKVKSQIPKQLSLIILKMMAKSPSDRYKSAFGIKNDLTRCLTLWKVNEDIPLFSLGEDDKGGILEISPHFYGRGEEFDTITKITKAKGRKSPLLVMIGGIPGSGKTSFVKELMQKIDLNEGYFLQAKYDQYQRNRPLTAMISAFSQLFNTIYEREGERGKNWIQEVLGENLPAITQLMPALELLMGTQGETVEVAPAEAQNRFVYNLSKIIELRSSVENPIVLFLDNMQWIDAASLNLLYSLAINPKCPGFIVVGAYRSSEVDQTHPLFLTLQKLEEEGSIVKKVMMGPLKKDSTTELVADTLGRRDEKLKNFASKLYVKSGGNPLLIEQLLITLYDKGIINFDDSKLLWDWDEEEVSKVKVATQVVDLVINKIEALPEDVQKMLFLAASFGEEMDLDVLAKVMGKGDCELTSYAEKALGLGIIDLFRNESGYCLIFAHDRFREACYQLLPKKKAVEEDKKLGLMLIKIWDEKRIQKNIFQITSLLNQAVSLLNEEKKHLLARLNLDASQKAIDSFSYKQGLEFVETGLSLLPSNAWKDHYDTIFKFHENGVIACAELKENEKIYIYYETLQKRAKDVTDSVKSCVTLIQYVFLRGDVTESLQIAKDYLKKLDFNFPLKGSKLLVVKEYTITRTLMWWKEKRNLPDKPLKDPRIKAIMDVLFATIQTLFFSDPTNAAFVCFSVNRLMLKYGTHEWALAFRILLFYIGRVSFHDTSLPRSIIDDVNLDDYRTRSYFPMLCNAYYGGIRNYFPLRAVIKNWEKHLLQMIGMGNLVYSASIYVSLLTTQLSASWSISKSKTFLEDYKQLLRKLDFYNMKVMAAMMYGFYNAIIEGGEFSISLDGEEITPDCLLIILEKKELHPQVFALSFLLLQRALIYRNGDEAWEVAKKGSGLRKDVMAIPMKEHFLLYEILAIGLVYEDKDKNEQKKMLKNCDSNIKMLKDLITDQKENFEYKYWMAKGEYTRILNDVDNAHYYYRKGILLAIENGFFHDTAIALERCGIMMLWLADTVLARVYFKEAIDFYDRWGAKAKVTEMEEEYTELLSQDQEQFFDLDTEISTSSSSSTMSELIDTQAYIGAAEAISEEIDLENLIKVLVSVVMKNAGAEHVVLLTVKDNNWSVTAEKKSGDAEVTFLSIPLKEASEKVPLTLVGEVIRLKEDIVIKNAYKNSRYSHDSYIANNKTLSILCLPLTFQNNLVATLYLENSLTKGAFTDQRVQNILLLSSHIANALENALLYEELKEYSHDLEEKVEQRKKEISEQNEALVEKNEAVNKNLEELKRTQNQLIATEKLASLGELTAGIAHEIRNPLNFINNFSGVNIEMFEENSEAFEDFAKQLEELQNGESNPKILELQKKGKELLEDFGTIQSNQKSILEHGKRSEKIISLMEQHSRVGKGTLVETKLSDLIDESLASAKISFHERFPNLSISIQKKYAEENIRLFLVQDEMAFVFYNVIKNAQEAMQERSEKEEGYLPELSIETNKVGDEVEIKIRDNGMGITEEDLEKVMNPFYTSKATGQAIGLALSLCHTIVTSIHHGTMTITSEPGAFTEARIRLPM